MRRIPFAIPDSSVIMNCLMSPVLATCLDNDAHQHAKDMMRYISSRSTTELNTSCGPFRVLDIPNDLIDIICESDDPHRVRICLTKNSSEAWNQLSFLKGKFSAEDFDISSYPILT